MSRFLWGGVLAVLFANVVGTASGATLANSVADFSGVQGQGGWYYGYYVADTPSSFTEAPQYDSTNRMWYEASTDYWLAIWDIGAHPEGLITSGGKATVDQWAARRWVSDYTGEVTITGKLNKFAAGGDGTLDSIYVDGQPVFSELATTTDPELYSVVVNLQEGDSVDFVTNPNTSDLYDATHFTGLISNDALIHIDSPPIVEFEATPEPGTLAYLGPCFLGLAWLLKRRRSPGTPGRAGILGSNSTAEPENGCVGGPYKTL